MPKYLAVEAVDMDDPGEPVVVMFADDPTAVPTQVAPVHPHDKHHVDMAEFARHGAKAGASAQAIASRFGHAGRLEAA